MSDTTLWGKTTGPVYRDFFDIQAVRLSAYGEYLWGSLTKADMTEDRSENIRLLAGLDSIGVAPNNRMYEFCLFTINPDKFEFPEGLDRPLTVGLYSTVGVEDNTKPYNWFSLWYSFMEDPAGVAGSRPYWNVDSVVGKYYDGVNDWPNYEPDTSTASMSAYSVEDPAGTHQFPFPSDAFEVMMYTYSWNTWGGLTTDLNRDDFYKYGGVFKIYSFDPTVGINNGDMFSISAKLNKIRIYYWNAVINSLSRYSAPSNPAGTQVIFYGHAFDIPNADIWAYAHNNSVNFQHTLYRIYFIGQQGQGTFTLVNGIDFTVDSNNQATATLPALPDGSYEIKVSVWDSKHGAEYGEGYAGDFRAAADGRAYPGERFVLRVGAGAEDEVPDEPPIILSDWKFYNGEFLSDHYAKIDVRGGGVFYDGFVLSWGTLTRAFDDETGLYSMSDLSPTLQNTDNYFSTRLFSYILKNQLMTLYAAWRHGAEAEKSTLFTMIVDDHDIAGPEFPVRLRDVLNKYMSQPAPAEVATEDEFPNIHDSARGRGFPIALGLNQHTGEAPGALEALYIDTANNKYLALGGSAAEMLEVYSAGVEKTEGAGNDYTITYEDGGRTYINFNADQGDNKITFNCKGYMFAGWNHADGYIRNPARIIEFFLAITQQIPIELIDTDSFDDLADQMEDLGWDAAGRLAIQEQRAAAEIIQELIFTIGAKLWRDRDGRITIRRIDRETLTAELTIWQQIDCISMATRRFNLGDAVNYAVARYDLYPQANFYAGTAEGEDAASVEDFGRRIEIQGGLYFPWTDSADLVDQRIAEILQELAYGRHEIEFSLPIRFIEDLDLATVFKFQNPFGLSGDGTGEKGRYYYIKSIAYNFDDFSMQIIAADLQWLAGQCFIFGDRDSLPATYSAASNEQRKYGFLCDRGTGRFLNNDPGKKLCDRET